MPTRRRDDGGAGRGPPLGPRPRGGPTAGFTLLEVLGAVAIIGVAFTLLARANIEGLRAEGIARRQLEASLLADRTLAGLEAQLQDGVVPDLGSREDLVEGYRVEVEVTPLEIDLPPLTEPVPEGFGEEDSGPSLLAPAAGGTPGGRGAPALLRRVRVEVAWSEGVSERSVLRETLVFDVAGAQALLGPLQQEGGDEAGAGPTPGAGQSLDALGGSGARR